MPMALNPLLYNVLLVHKVLKFQINKVIYITIPHQLLFRPLIIFSIKNHHNTQKPLVIKSSLNPSTLNLNNKVVNNRRLQLIGQIGGRRFVVDSVERQHAVDLF